MPLSSGQLAELVRVYQETVGGYAAEVAARVAQAWDDLPGYDAADVGAFADAVAPILEAGKAVTVRTTSGYLARVTGTPTVAITPAMVPAIAPDPRTPFTAMWRMLNSDRPATHRTMTAGEVEAIARAAGRSAAIEGATTHIHRVSRQTGGPWEARTKANVVGWRRVLTGTSCEWCGIVATQRYRSAESADFGHHACVVGSTVVDATSTRSLSRRFYRGEFVTIRTASGQELTITPNHPVLTWSGWVAAGLLNEGDDVVRCTAIDRGNGVVPHEHDGPSRVEDRFRAALVGGLVRVPFAAEDFHGDAGQGDVDVVPADSHLATWPLSVTAQDVDEASFARAGLPGVSFSRLCSEHQALLAGRDTSGGVVSSGRLGLALVGAHASGALEPSGRSSADGHASGDELTTNSGAVDPVRIREREFAFPVLVPVCDPDEFEGSWTDLNVAAPEFSSKRVATDADSARRLRDRLASQVSADRIVEISRFDGAHEVFNLSTRDGWYSASQIVVHNCDCGVAPIVGDRDPGRYINEDLAANLDPTISRRIDVNRYAETQTKAAANAERRRDSARSELAGETDPERRIRLEGRVRRWDNRAASYRAKAARSQADLEAPDPGPGHTGYVGEDGRPAPRPTPTPKVDA